MAVPTASATPVFSAKPVMGVTASPAQASTPTARKTKNIFFRIPLKSPSAPITGASSAEISMAMLVT